MISRATSAPYYQKLANVFGSFGYLAVILVWFWMSLILCWPYIQDSGLRDVFLPQQRISHTEISQPGLPQPLQIIIMVSAIIFSVGVCLYAIYAIPRTIGRAGKKATSAGTNTTLSHVAYHHKPLSSARKKRLYEYISWSIKLIMLLLPTLLLFIPPKSGGIIPHDVSLLVGAVLSGIALMWFALQYLIAKIARLDPQDIW